ncbi:MAG: hypothetical protein R6V56_01300, partial [Lentisphaeria bacterium]
EVFMSTGDNATVTSRKGTLLAWAFYDWGNSAFSTVIMTFVFSAYFTERVALDKETGTLWWGLTVGIAGFTVALTAPIVGALIDQTRRRRPWLTVTTLACVTATASLWFIRPVPEMALPAVLLAGAGIWMSAMAMMSYNAMLPALAPRERIGHWSGWGWGLGYAGGLLCLAQVAKLGLRIGQSTHRHVRHFRFLSAGRPAPPAGSPRHKLREVERRFVLHLCVFLTDNTEFDYFAISISDEINSINHTWFSRAVRRTLRYRERQCRPGFRLGVTGR